MTETSGIAAELDQLRDSIRRFLEREVVPHAAAWREAGCVDRAAWQRAGALGILGISTPAAYGGLGGDFRHEVVLIEELGRIGFFDFNMPLHNAIVTPYIVHYGSEAQKQHWLPRLASGALIAAIGMTEPGTGSDLRAIRTTARREADCWVLNGQKTFISNGQLANLIVVAAQTPTPAGERISLIVLETEGAAGFRRGRKLAKLGARAQDTSELFFDDVRVPAENLLGGTPGQGFAQMAAQLAQERLLIAVQAVASMEAALAVTLDYVKQRKAFGQTVLEFQNSRFGLAEARTETVIARVFLQHCIDRLVAGTLDAGTAAMAKLWTTERQFQILDLCLQLHGGYGYMLDYPIAQMWADARVQRIYGGTSEIMKEIISRGL